MRERVRVSEKEGEKKRDSACVRVRERNRWPNQNV